MAERWRQLLAVLACLAAVPAAAQQAPAPALPTVRLVPQEALISPAAPPVVQPWTVTDLTLVRPEQTFADLRRRFASQVRFRGAAQPGDPDRVLFVPGAARLGAQVFNLSFVRSPGGRNAAHLVTIAGSGSQAQCDSKFQAFLAAITTTLGLKPGDWQPRSTAAAGTRSPFALHDSWSGSGVWSINVLRNVFDGTVPAAPRTAPGGAKYGVVRPEMIYGTRHAIAFAGADDVDSLTIALAEFGQEGSPAPGQCRLALVRLGPAPATAQPATWTPPTGQVIRRAALERTRTLAWQYARLQPAGFGALPAPAALPQGTVQLDCTISPEDGALTRCRPAGSPEAAVTAVNPEPNPAIRSVAGVLAALRLPSWRFDEDFFEQIPVQLEFTAQPDDLPPVIDWDAAPLQPANAVSFDRPLRVLSDDYPSPALRTAQEAMIMIDCVVLPDLSPWCGRYLIEPVEAAAAFTPVLRVIQRRNVVRRARPLGKDGQTAIGQRFRQRIIFKVPS